jgi:hypothetical protein
MSREELTMDTAVEAKLAKLMARQAELKWLQMRTAQLPRSLAEELASSEAIIAAATSGPARAGAREAARGLL